MKALIFLTIFLNIIYLSSQVEMKIFDRPGFYTLSPSDYGYQNYIIIEMWGAGSGSSTTYFKNNTVLYCPGNSGSYIKFRLYTELQNYYFNLGEGGLCYNTNSHPDTHILHNYIGGDGEDSLFYDNNDLTMFNIEGGYSYIPNNNYAYIEDYSYSYKYRSNVFYEIIKYYPGITDLCFYNEYNTRCGSHSPYGYECENSLECNGYMGSGAGYDCNNNNYKGGDGALILYY